MVVGSTGSEAHFPTCDRKVRNEHSSANDFAQVPVIVGGPEFGFEALRLALLQVAVKFGVLQNTREPFLRERE